MSNIERLRNRLRDVGKSTTEYRMTTTEAKNLLKEIEDLEQELERIKQEKPQQVVVNEPAWTTRTIDGGAF